MNFLTSVGKVSIGAICMVLYGDLRTFVSLVPAKSLVL